jgi:hypothetical protein
MDWRGRMKLSEKIKIETMQSVSRSNAHAGDNMIPSLRKDFIIIFTAI